VLFSAAILRVPIVVVVHNPIAERHDNTGTLARGIASRLIVHDEDLTGPQMPGNKMRVVGHPSYSAWWNRFGVRRDAVALPSRDVLYAGVFRRDKGSEDIVLLAHELASRGLRLVVASKVADSELREELEDAGCLVLSPSGEPVSDACLATAYAACRALVAPYENVTVSGTMVMAVTAGLPIVSYASRASRKLVDPACPVKSGDVASLALAAAHLVAGAGSSPRTPAALDADSCLGWLSVLAELDR
jgi:hypothetical protein